MTPQRGPSAAASRRRSCCLGACCLVPLCLLVQLALGVMSFLAVRRIPSALVIHTDPGAVRRIVVEDQYARVTTFERPNGEVRVRNIAHGPYLVQMRFADGRTGWCSYFHCDAGDRRRADLWVSHKPHSGVAHVRCDVVTYASVDKAHTETGYEGDVDLAKTSREHPDTLSPP